MERNGKERPVLQLGILCVSARDTPFRLHAVHVPRFREGETSRRNEGVAGSQ
jgi:hypothetical protein